MVPTIPQATDAVLSAVQRAPTEVAGKVGQFVLSSVDSAIESRWIPAQERAGKIKGDSVEEKVKGIAKLYAYEMGVVGAARGAAAAVPALGTAASLSTGVAEFGWYTVRTAELILTIGALHGHEQSTIEERRAWILSILIFGDGAAAGFTKMAGELGKGLGKKATEKIPTTLLKAINSSLGQTIVTKYGKKRGAIALGSALPFGIGAVVGGSLNYTGVRLLARHANKFFANLPYRAVVDVEPPIALPSESALAASTKFTTIDHVD